jgi:hypothetical protein
LVLDCGRPFKNELTKIYISHPCRHYTIDSAAGCLWKKWKNLKGFDLDCCHLFGVIIIYIVIDKTRKKSRQN